jgi:hypothetical protein
MMNIPRASTAEDQKQASVLLRALRNGATALAGAQVIAPFAEPEDRLLADLIVAPITAPAQPTMSEVQRAAMRSPDISLTVAKMAIQYALRIYAQQHFIDQSFVLPPQPMLEVVARGASIAVELLEGEARIAASFDCAATMSATVAGRRVALGTLRTPVDITAGACLSINTAGQLCVGIGAGEVRVPHLPLPVGVLNTLYQRIRETLPAVPIVYLPTRFDVPSTPSFVQDEVQVQLSGIHVVPEALTLEFQLFFGPAAGPLVEN